ncbi:hypothetical protein JXA63_05090 [Candidatus Woesebacteria bacterium]|nr:hypothetical protein [Candidatus Woesebacteria bacterium]
MLILPSIVSRFIVFTINVTGFTLIANIISSPLKKILKRIFVMMSVLMFVWVDCAFLARQVGQTELSLFFIRVAWSITPILFILIYSFIVNFLDVTDKYKLLSIISYFVGIIFMFITLTSDLIISGISFQNGVLNIIYGKFVWAFFGAVTVYTIVNFYLLFKYYLSQNTDELLKKRIKYLIGGLTLFFIANAVFNIIFPIFFNIFHLYEFGDYTTVIFISIIAYAVVKGEFFNIKILTATFIAIFLGSFLLLDAVLLSQNFAEAILKSVIFALYVPFGYLLVRSVMTEIRQREQLEERTKELRETQKRELAKANELLKLKDEFVFIATHDLRTPVTAIRGYLDMIQNCGDEFSEETKENFKFVMQSSDRLNRLVNDLLEVARSESGTIKVEVKPVDIVPVIEKCIKEVEPSAAENNIEIKTEIGKDEWYVLGDGVKLEEVMENLLTNGVKYNKQGGELKVSLKEEDKSLVVSVSDTGIGIPKEHQDKVFEKFFRSQTEKTKDITGTGLGLFVVRMLIEKMKGTITFKSTEGEGTTFIFKLKLADKVN